MKGKTFRVEIRIMLLPELVDPQGNTVYTGLRRIGFSEVQQVRIGKHIQILLQANSREEARRRVQQMCESLLVNPVVEQWEIVEIAPLSQSPSDARKNIPEQ